MLSDWILARKESLTLLLAILISLLLIFSNDTPQVETIRVWSFAGVGAVLAKISTFDRLFDLEEENRLLRQENSELMLENSRMKETLQENRRLHALLGFQANSDWDLIAAKVIGKQQGGFINAVILDVGESDSVAKNMAAVTPDGLVGKIYSVGSNFVTVQLVLDHNFRASAVVQRSRVNGVIRWLEGNRLELTRVPKRSDIETGDEVVTSALSSIFPPGLRIGRVSHVAGSEQDMFMDVAVKPTVDFNKLEEVFVIKWIKPFSTN